MSTGAKIAIGCGGLVVVGLIVFVIAAVVGGMFLKDKAEEFAGGVEAQQRATETMRELEEEHDFSVPPDGVVGEDRAETFFDVTDDAWEEMEDFVREWRERGERIDEGDASPGDVIAGIGAIGELGRSRVVLADALEEHEMPASEYVWTGVQLVRAYEALDASGEAAIPDENLEVAREHRDALGEISESSEEGGTGKGFVLWMAWTWSGESGVKAMGWDTLRPDR
ncbi:MAG: hypothetical protein R3326_07840 [Gemmatimonadota bacterium]|nr:hypothetical protein [Gemmatimonadota bacterium]